MKLCSGIHTEFHNYFRMEFKQIYQLADCYEEEGLSLSEFLRHARSLHQRELRKQYIVYRLTPLQESRLLSACTFLCELLPRPFA